MGNSWMVPKNKEPLLACLPLAADGSHAQVRCFCITVHAKVHA